ncbi:hypothetical protein WR25_07174 [Diploscapter pachys]|uniref:Protein kinase domain-containing protein n=1 Tax=Diploscapter pachys TaxID=2018661 RepID=A0A2A2KUH3_9BILA|nr:hypothetical protein WR25_07174 [Diploscapter pachys]
MNFVTGGDNCLNTRATLGNIFKTFNPDIKGLSKGISSENSTEKARFNLAKSGGLSYDLLWETRELVNRIKLDKSIHFDKDWKFINLFIGTNNLCYFCKDEQTLGPEKYFEDLKNSIEYLRANLPRVFLNLMPSFHVEIISELHEMSSFCEAVHRKNCPCTFEMNKEEYANIKKEFDAKLDLFNSVEYQRPDFAIVVSPAINISKLPFLGSTPNLAFIAADCFHFSEIAHDFAAKEIWANLFEPFDKRHVVDDFDDIHPDKWDCPPYNCPYLKTPLNSYNCSMAKYRAPSPPIRPINTFDIQYQSKDRSHRNRAKKDGQLVQGPKADRQKEGVQQSSDEMGVGRSPNAERSSSSSSGLVTNTPGPAELKEDLRRRLRRTHNIEVEKRIGKGTYSKVYLAKVISTQAVVVLKIIEMKPEEKTREFLNRFLPREIQICRLLSQHRHLNIIQNYRIIDDIRPYVVFVTEQAAGGTLLSRIQSERRIKEEHAKPIFRQIIDALKFLTTLDIVHRDIKCENILFDAAGNVKLCDFGFARLLRKNEWSSTFCGSRVYCPPEFLIGEPYTGTASEVWSVGVVLFVTVTGQMPFDEHNPHQMLECMQKQQLKFPTRYQLSSEVRALILTILNPSAQLRPTYDEILAHIWLSDPTE